MVEESVEPKILRQVEYYFGDINLPRDKFLQEEMKKDNGWVELTTMLKFNRLAQITTDLTEIAAALEKSELIELSDDKTKIRRSPEVPLPDNTLEYWQEIKRRTAYVKGFDVETTLDEIQNFLAPHGNVQNVVMRRLTKERTFKGSIFATFDTREIAEKFVKDESSMTYKDKPLTKMLQDEYWTAKVKASKEKRQAEKQAKLTKKLEQIAEQSKQKLIAKYVKGAVLEVSGLDPKETKYEDLKTFFKTFGPVAFCAYEAGDETARIRFNEENAATTAWDAALKKGQGKVVFNEKELTGKVLGGEDEEKYWSEFNKSKIQKQVQQKGKSKSGRAGGKNKKRGNYGGVAKHTVFKDEEDDIETEQSVKTESKKRSHSGEEEPSVKKAKQETTDGAEIKHED